MRFFSILLLAALGCATGEAGRGACYLREGSACVPGALTVDEGLPIRCRAGGESDLVYYRELVDCRKERKASVATGGNADTARIPDGPSPGTSDR